MMTQQLVDASIADIAQTRAFPQCVQFGVGDILTLHSTAERRAMLTVLRMYREQIPGRIDALPGHKHGLCVVLYTEGDNPHTALHARDAFELANILRAFFLNSQ